MKPNSAVGTLRRRGNLASARARLPTYTLGNTMEEEPVDDTIDSPTDYLGNTALQGMATDWLPNVSASGFASLATFSFLGAALLAYIRYDEFKPTKSPMDTKRLISAAKWGGAAAVLSSVASGLVKADQTNLFSKTADKITGE